MQRRHLLALGTAAALPLPSFAQGSKPQALKFTLDFRISGQVAPFFVALAKGYYAQEGLAPSFDVGSGSVAAITRVASGAYDMGFGDLSALMEFQATQGPLVQAVYQYYNRAPFVIIARKDRGVSDFKSLAGKRIAAAAVESTRRAWPRRSTPCAGRAPSSCTARGSPSAWRCPGCGAHCCWIAAGSRWASSAPPGMRAAATPAMATAPKTPARCCAARLTCCAGRGRAVSCCSRTWAWR